MAVRKSRRVLWHSLHVGIALGVMIAPTLGWAENKADTAIREEVKVELKDLVKELKNAGHDTKEQDNDLLVPLGRAHRMVGDTKGLSELVGLCRRSYGETPGYLQHALAMTYASLGQVSAAETASADISRGKQLDVLLRLIRTGIERNDSELEQTARRKAITIAMVESEQWCRADYLVKIGEELARLGRKKASAMCLSAARSALVGCSDRHALMVLCNLANACGVIGKNEQAEQAVARAEAELGSVPDDTLDRLSYGEAIFSLAVCRARLGQMNESFRLLEMVPRGGGVGPGEGYARVAAALLQLGKCDDGLLAIGHIPRSYLVGNELLVAAMRGLSRRGDIEKALSLVKRIQSPSRKAEAMLALAEAYADAGDVKAARSAVSQIALVTPPSVPRETPGVYSLGDPNTWYTEYDYDGFFSVSLAFTNEVAARDLCVQSIRVYTKLRLGNMVESLPAKCGTLRPSLMYEIAREVALACGPGEALKWARKMDSSPVRAWALAGIAEVAARGNERQVRGK